MPRPKKERRIDCPPRWLRYKPVGVSTRLLQQIELNIDEYEAIRLSDHEGMDHMKASRNMGISRSTFTRLIEQAHKKIALFLLHGGELQIKGGVIRFRDNLYQCEDCGAFLRRPFDEPLYECSECGSGKLVNYAQHYFASETDKRAKAEK
ncbi:MAG: DUF134 domain-containing protein [Candidatus Cloacimonetes bacterium]|nr:DUF134 domain-containing protein [Candidatus Cloacimonadota bacterium]